MEDNLNLWEAVHETDPKHTRKANVGGNKITSIKPQYQILNATKQWGSYGKTWGFKDIELDYSLTNIPIKIKVVDYNTKAESEEDTILGIVGLKATFYYPDGEFEIINSVKIFTDKAHNKIDDDFAKKIETDTLTKALSKLGFNADVFMGRFDDVRYVDDMDIKHGNKQDPKVATAEMLKAATTEMLKTATKEEATAIWNKYPILQKNLEFVGITKEQGKKISDGSK